MHTRTRVMDGRLPDLVCLSHLRWNFVFQRPQHLMSRFARERRVFFVEEPIWGPEATHLQLVHSPEKVWVATPYIQVEGATAVTPDPPPGKGLPREQVEAIQEEMLNQLLAEQNVSDYVVWYYTPMALGFSRQLTPRATIYDCMDELSAFAGAPPVLLERESELYTRADRVFTGGHSLFEAKRSRHPAVYPFPSSVDVPHFKHARENRADPPDQASIPHPRLGYFGVIDERMDLELLAEMARLRPDWHIVMLGPVVKINPAAVPQAPNLHWLGSKKYDELPDYLAGWDVALIPFACNESTRFISPTKTPEYLAAGKPVVSSPIRDVIRPYGVSGLVDIADTAEAFVEAAEARMAAPHEPWLAQVDALLGNMSWDLTWSRMKKLMDDAADGRTAMPFVADGANAM